MSFGQRLKRTREALDVSARELSRRSGVDLSQIIKIERDMASPRLDTIERLADALGIDPASLIAGKDYGEDPDLLALIASYRKLPAGPRRGLKAYVMELSAHFRAADEAKVA